MLAVTDYKLWVIDDKGISNVLRNPSNDHCAPSHRSELVRDHAGRRAHGACRIQSPTADYFATQVPVRHHRFPVPVSGLRIAGWPSPSQHNFHRVDRSLSTYSSISFSLPGVESCRVRVEGLLVTHMTTIGCDGAGRSDLSEYAAHGWMDQSRVDIGQFRWIFDSTRFSADCSLSQLILTVRN